MGFRVGSAQYGDFVTRHQSSTSFDADERASSNSNNRFTTNQRSPGARSGWHPLAHRDMIDDDAQFRWQLFNIGRITITPSTCSVCGSASASISHNSTRVRTPPHCPQITRPHRIHETVECLRSWTPSEVKHVISAPTRLTAIGEGSAVDNRPSGPYPRCFHGDRGEYLRANTRGGGQVLKFSIHGFNRRIGSG